MTSCTQYCILQKDIFKSVGKWLLIFWECLTPMKNTPQNARKRSGWTQSSCALEGDERPILTFRTIPEIVFFQCLETRTRICTLNLRLWSKNSVNLSRNSRWDWEFPAGIDLGQVAPPSQPPPLQSGDWGLGYKNCGSRNGGFHIQNGHP